MEEDQEQNFIHNVEMFLCTFLKGHGNRLGEKRINDLLVLTTYLLLISKVEIFKICLEYWNDLVEKSCTSWNYTEKSSWNSSGVQY